jgi:hypothetical protein
MPIISSSIRIYPDQTHYARVEMALDPKVAAHLARATDVRFKTCRPNARGDGVWGPPPNGDAVHVQFRWETDHDYVEREAPLKDGTRCMVCH